MAHKGDKPGKSCCKCVLQKTMKGADKAIVAKSFGKWESGSLRSRTVEKPDELSEESEHEKPSRSTGEDPQVGEKAADKRSLSPRRPVHHVTSPSLFCLEAILIITAATCFVFLLF